MRRRKIIKRIVAAGDAITEELSVAYQGRNTRYAVLISEGYDGGYRDVLRDVVLLFNDVIPARNHWWVIKEKP